jgi:hypothetical protein
MLEMCQSPRHFVIAIAASGTRLRWRVTEVGLAPEVTIIGAGPVFLGMPARAGIEGPSSTFNVLRGGEYFFMPSLSALRWLGDLG